MSGDDTLGRVALSHSAVKRWHERASELAREARKRGIRKPADIPDELARLMREAPHLLQP